MSIRYSVTILIGQLMLVAASSMAAKPNVVVILADDVGREVIGCYGGSSYATPEIDALAASGIQFEHCYAMPMCHPTRISFLTGRYPFRLKHPEWLTFPRSWESRTIAGLFKNAGYSTCVSGKWQLALLKDAPDHPHRLGFEEYCLTGWHEGPWFYDPLIYENGEVRDDIGDRYGPDVECDFVVDFIRRNRRQPFFIYYPMTLCHSETNDLKEPAPVGPHGRYDSFEEMVPKMDHCVGRVIDELEKQGLRDSTLVLFLGDNGTARENLIRARGQEYTYEKVVSLMGDREIPGGKGTLTDWGTRVPLIASQPGVIAAGKINKDLVSITDFVPTTAQILGVDLPAGGALDGQAIPALVEGASPRTTVFCEHHLGGCFVRNQRWKLYNDGRLFDMDANSDEKRPLAKEGLSGEEAASKAQLEQALFKLGYSPPN